ncbi:hypothetical protein BC831DRAFT_440121 [Entophlyctis helioformis]|nr:hypothetical protein BC831DRAFT_440121 [Entophlyctis helioformis]
MDFGGASAAECGPGGNALSQLSKQLSADTSAHQQDRVTGGLGQGGPSSARLMRQRDRQHMGPESELAQEFLHLGMPARMADPFHFGAVNRELESIHPGMLSASAPKDWAAEFHGSHAAGPSVIHAPNDAQFHEMQLAFDAARNASHSATTGGWASEFQMHHHEAAAAHDPLHPEMARHFDEAFERAKEAVSWENQFASEAAPASWDAEFEQLQSAQRETVIDADSVPDAMSKTADLLLDIVSKSTNPKFKESRFVDFIQKLRDKEIAIEGNKVVEQIAPASGSKSWADDFMSTHGAAPKPAASWEEDFAALHPQQPLAPQSAEFGDWAQEFASSGGQLDAEADWAKQFAGTSSDGILGDLDGQLDRDLYEQDWANQFRNQMAELPKDEQDMEWERLSKAWDAQQGFSSGYAADNDVRFMQYEFTSNNPYLDASFSDSFLRNVQQHNNLTESILALEAAVQRAPGDAEAWRILGLKQQENENDVLAIAALRRCVEIEPSNLEALMALSVAYTNENYVNEAYDALNSWIAHNPRYEHDMAMASSERHAIVTEKFISAAGSRPGADLDEDVQIALGVLFNISSEYDKAVDCFEAGLSKRPDDYMLWNKLGTATLANSNHPGRAMDAYFNALQINPSYIRARYNLGIACIQIGQYREAAEHLLGALSVQQQNIAHVEQMSVGKGKGKAADVDASGTFSSLTSAQSNSVWSTLRLLADTYIHRKDLAEACERHDLTPFRGEFDF